MNHQNISRENYQTYVWFRKAAELGDAYAQFNLGLMYKKGEGIERDYAAAFKWLRQAAQQGLAFAQNHLGALYYNGRGV
jgi:hypothetical protein